MRNDPPATSDTHPTVPSSDARAAPRRASADAARVGPRRGGRRRAMRGRTWIVRVHREAFVISFDFLLCRRSRRSRPGIRNALSLQAVAHLFTIFHHELGLAFPVRIRLYEQFLALFDGLRCVVQFQGDAVGLACVAGVIASVRFFGPRTCPSAGTQARRHAVWRYRPRSSSAVRAQPQPPGTVQLSDLPHRPRAHLRAALCTPHRPALPVAPPPSVRRHRLPTLNEHVTDLARHGTFHRNIRGVGVVAALPIIGQIVTALRCVALEVSRHNDVRNFVMARGVRVLDVACEARAQPGAEMRYKLMVVVRAITATPAGRAQITIDEIPCGGLHVSGDKSGA